MEDVLQGKNNYINVEGTGRSHAQPTGGIKETKSDGGLPDVTFEPVGYKAQVTPDEANGKKDQQTVTHELLHLFGLVDRYKDVNVVGMEKPVGQADKGYADDVMGTGGYIEQVGQFKNLVEQAKQNSNKGINKFKLEKYKNYDVENQK